MSIFDRVDVFSTERQRLNDFNVRRPVLELEAGKTGRMRDTIDQSTEFELRLRLVQNFWANQAQYASAHKAAMRALAAHLYEDVLRDIHYLILAIESGDREEALTVALRMKELTQP